MSKVIELSAQATFIYLCVETIAEHTSELTIRRKQLTRTSSDGVVDSSRWAEEVESFIVWIVEPQAGQFRHFPRCLEKVRSLIDAATVHYLSSRICFCLDDTPDCYEQLVSNSLSDLGWHTQLINIGESERAAVMAEMRGERILIICRRYASSVGILAIEDTHGLQLASGANYVVVVSNGGFTNRARQLAKSQLVILLHHNRLMELEERLFGTDAWRGIPPRIARDARSIEAETYVTDAA